MTTLLAFPGTAFRHTPSAEQWPKRFYRSPLSECASCGRRRGFAATYDDGRVVASCGECVAAMSSREPRKLGTSAFCAGRRGRRWRRIVLSFECASCGVAHEFFPPYFAHPFWVDAGGNMTDTFAPCVDPADYGTFAGVRCDHCWGAMVWPNIRPEGPTPA